MTHTEARASVIDEVIARINPLKKSKSAQSEDTSGPLRSKKPLAPEELYHGEVSKTGKRMYTSDEILFLDNFGFRSLHISTAPIFGPLAVASGQL